MDRKKFTGIIICVLLLTVFFALFSEGQAQSKKPAGQAKKLSEQGDRFFGRKDYRSAVNKYAEATVISPNFPYANFWKGYAHYYLKEYDQAVKDLDKALEQGYKPVLELYKTRGYSNYQLKNYDAALRDVRQVLEAEPTNVNFYSLLGNIYYAQGSYQDSIDAFKKVLQFDPNNADVNYFMALSYAGLSDYAQQGLFAAEAVKKNTKFVGESYYLTADAFRRAKKLNEAIEAYERAINVKPELYEVYNSLADIYRNENRLDEAIATEKKGLTLYPNDGNLYISISRYYSLADRHAEAIGAAKQAIQFLPNEYKAYTNLCRAYNDLKLYQPAIEACLKALQLNPADGETNFYLARAYDLTNRRDTATLHYKRAVDGLVDYTNKNPEYTDGYYLLGNAYVGAEQRDKAIEAYKKSLALSPKFAKARYNLGYMYFLTDDLKSAREQYNALLEIDADLAAKLKQAMEKK